VGFSFLVFHLSLEVRSIIVNILPSRWFPPALPANLTLQESRTGLSCRVAIRRSNCLKGRDKRSPLARPCVDRMQFRRIKPCGTAGDRF